MRTREWNTEILLSLRLTMKFIAQHIKKVTNDDLFSQDRGHYIVSYSPAIFLKFILKNPSSVIESWLMAKVHVFMIWIWWQSWGTQELCLNLKWNQTVQVY